jgi:hypothetical protein
VEGLKNPPGEIEWSFPDREFPKILTPSGEIGIENLLRFSLSEEPQWCELPLTTTGSWKDNFQTFFPLMEKEPKPHICDAG